MNEKVKAVKTRVVTFWNKYDQKQKTLFISIVAVLIVAIAIMAVVFNRPQWETVIECEDSATAAKVVELLTEQQIEYNAKTDTIIQVKKEDMNSAQWALASQGIPTKGYGIDDALNGGFSQTESDKNRKYQAYLEDQIRIVLESLDYVKSASVHLNIPTSTLSVLNAEKETSAAVFLNLQGEFPDGAGKSIAQFVATAVGNGSVSKVTIMDQEGNTLFSGEDENLSVSDGSLSLSAQQRIQEYAENKVISNIKKLFAGTNNTFDTVDVSTKLSMSFDKGETTKSEYYIPDDAEQGPYKSSYEVNQTGSSGVSGIPGTDSNDEDITDYQLTTSDGSSSKYELKKYEYAVSQIVETTTNEVGKIAWDDSSVSIVLTSYNIYNQETMETNGELDGTTWEEFKRDNADRTEIALTDQDIEFVSMATGIPVENIRIRAYSIPEFTDAPENRRSITDYMQIILAVIILALLGFVIWRATRPVEVTELEPELSVEEMLASTQELQESVDDIDLNDKSDTRKAIEKFVEENPEATAILLRNWLNDDWD